MSNYDPSQSPLYYLSKHSAGMSQYEFDTFIVGKHHSRARMLQDLLRRKSEALEIILGAPENTLVNLENQQLIKMIDIELEKHDINNLADFEYEEVAYWIDELARTSALEINTYGRIKPETMDKLMLMEEEHFVSAMNKTGLLVSKLKIIAEGAHCINAPMPGEMPST